MSLYLKQIEQLVELQKIDDAIYAVKQELKHAPQEVESLEQSFAAAEAQRHKVLDKLSHIQDQQKRLDLEIDDDALRIKKSKNKLMQVGNTREYHAMMREVDSIEKLNRTREEEKLTLLEETQLQNDALAEVNGAYESLKTERDAKRDTLQERVDNATARLSAFETTRANAGSEVPVPIFQRYEFIRFRLEHPVIVPVESGICNGCHIAIPPQTFIELQRGQQILSCPNCQRLIYWCEHFTSPEEIHIS